MEYFKETRLLFVEMLVDDMDDFEDVKHKSFKKSIKKTKSFIEAFFVLALTSLKFSKMKPKRGNYLRNDRLEGRQKKSSFRIIDLHYIVLIKLVDFMEFISP